ncbi:hypothetical protein Tco_1216139 [Tanacetum coccineum]
MELEGINLGKIGDMILHMSYVADGNCCLNPIWPCLAAYGLIFVYLERLATKMPEDLYHQIKKAVAIRKLYNVFTATRAFRLRCISRTVSYFFEVDGVKKLEMKVTFVDCVCVTLQNGEVVVVEKTAGGRGV